MQVRFITHRFKMVLKLLINWNIIHIKQTDVRFKVREIMKAEEYPEMTNEEYKQKINEDMGKIESNQKLRYFYIYEHEKNKRAE